MGYRTIVVGTDGSATADHAVDSAIELALADACRLVIVTAFERVDHDAHDELPGDIRWIVNDANEAESHARACRERAHAAGVHDVVVQAVEGSPAERLLETVEDFGADLVVVGSVGLTNSARLLLGSVASTVLHHATSDVLVARTT